VRLLKRDKLPDPDNYVKERVTRGQARLRELAPQRNECWQFFRGNTYVYRTQENQLVAQATQLSIRGGKSRNRVRVSRPILTPFVRQEVSSATQRVPSYDVTPSNSDPKTVAAAKVSEKVALYGYDQWRIKDATEKVVTSAVVADEGFAWPYWDDTYGQQVGVEINEETGETRPLYEGDICIRTYTANEVGWEPGQRFEDSRWFMIQQARPVDEVLRMPGILAEALSPDGTDRQVIGTGKPTANTRLVLVVEYLERPSLRYPRGRRLVMANGKEILPEEPYPLTDAKGMPVDEPVLHKLSVLKDPDSDRDHGLVKFCLDALRTYQDCNNKALEYKNHMVPQIVTNPGNILSPVTDEPNAVIEVGNPDRVKFRDSPGIPSQLFEIMDRAYQDVARIFSQNAIPSQVESGKGIEALLAADQNARAAFLQNLAEFHSRLMRHCLVLVQKHYTEPRDLLIVGEFGPDYMYGFLGADLMSQCQVRVRPESLQVYSREQVKQDVAFYAQMQWISPEEAITAIENGTLEGVGAGFEYDKARAHLIMDKIKQGPEVLFAMPNELKDIPLPPQQIVDPVTGQVTMQPVVDPSTGLPMTQTIEVPGWMPRPVDNTRIHKAEFAKWMKSADWQRLEPGMREAARQYWHALDSLEAEEAAKAQAQQMAMSQELGAANAAKPQFKATPSLPNPAMGEPGSMG